MTTLHIFHTGDLYEVILRDHVISRITRYCGGESDTVPFDHLPEAVKDKVLDEVMKVLQSSDE